METVSFKQSRNFKNIAAEIFREQKQTILEKLPNADIQHVAGTSIPGLITKGDVDINVRVAKEEFDSAIEALKSLYNINQIENWTDNFASFKDNKNLQADFGVQLTVIGSPDDFFVDHKNLLLGNPRLVQELNALKMKYEGKSMEEYRKEKNKFFDKLTKF